MVVAYHSNISSSELATKLDKYRIGLLELVLQGSKVLIYAA